MRDDEITPSPLAYDLLRYKRETTRFQILVEIAEHQPSIRQLEIAEKLSLTPQAISEYMRALTADGYISAEGRGRYSVTYKGIELIENNAEAIESYARHVRRDVVHLVVTWAAIADSDLKKGDAVGLYMKNGWLYAGKKPQTAMGKVAADAAKGDDAGIIRLAGIIEHTEGKIKVAKVPRIERGGSLKIDTEKAAEAAADADFVGAIGLEAYLALKKSGVTPDMFYGAREGVIEAAFHGLNCLLLIVDEELTDFLKRLEASGLSYSLSDLVKK